MLTINESKVTKLLSCEEIINNKKTICPNICRYNLGKIAENPINNISVFGSRYLFVK